MVPDLKWLVTAPILQFSWGAVPALQYFTIEVWLIDNHFFNFKAFLWTMHRYRTIFPLSAFFQSTYTVVIGYYYPFILQCTNNRSMFVNPDLCCCVQVPTWSWWLRRRVRVRCVAGMFGGSLRQRSSRTAGPTTISPRPRQRPTRSKQWGFFVGIR